MYHAGDRLTQHWLKVLLRAFFCSMKKYIIYVPYHSSSLVLVVNNFTILTAPYPISINHTSI